MILYCKKSVLLSMRSLPGIILLILLLAFLLRTYGLQELVYANPDEALWAYFIVTRAQLSAFAPRLSENALAHILSWDYGYPLFVLDYCYVRALEALGLPISEATLPLPLAVFGTLNCGLVFLITRRIAYKSVPWLGNVRQAHAAALLAASFVAVMPLLVGRSRSIGGAEACSGFLFLLAVWQIMRYLQQPQKRKHQWLAGLCLGLYLCADVQFLLGGMLLLALLLMWPLPTETIGLASSRANMPQDINTKENDLRAEAQEQPSLSSTNFEPAPSGVCLQNNWRQRALLIWQPGLLLPPVILFFPYIPAWLYAIHLGYPEQTYLGTIFAEHKADWGFHLFSFGRDLAANTGVFPLLGLPLALGLFLRCWQRPQQWLLLWIVVTAMPFLIAVTEKTTQASGYHEHLLAALAITLGLSWGRWLAAPSQAHKSKPSLAVFRGLYLVCGILVGGALCVTLGGVWRVAPLHKLWPSSPMPYGARVPNSGMKAAGYWIRQNVPAKTTIFVAHDPAVAYWYCGRPCLTGGYVPCVARKEAFLRQHPQIQIAVIPGQKDLFPPELFAQLGFPGRVIFYWGREERLNIYLREPKQARYEIAQLDRLYYRLYRASRTIIPPPWPYAPEKPLPLLHPHAPSLLKEGRLVHFHKPIASHN